MQIVLFQLEQHRHALSQRPHSHSDDDVSNCSESTQWITTRTSYCPLSILLSLCIQNHCHSSNSLLIITSASLRLSYLSGPLFPHHHLSRPSSTVASSSSTTLHRTHTQSTAFCLPARLPSLCSLSCFWVLVCVWFCLCGWIFVFLSHVYYLSFDFYLCLSVWPVMMKGLITL